MKKTIGILAHVDAGKTTLSERILYLNHVIRSVGRVDTQNTFLDFDPIERARGITVFSGQAVMHNGEDTIYWLDTPGHVDFSAEMERALSVLDYAVLVVSCVEGVQSHTETLWRILSYYHVPTFIFLNKSDRVGANCDAVIERMKKALSTDIFDIREYQQNGAMSSEMFQEIAAYDEQYMDAFFAGESDVSYWENALSDLIRRRYIFPVMSGSALNDIGIASFYRVLQKLTCTDYEYHIQEPVSGTVYKVQHDPSGNRTCFIKLLSGHLKVKDELYTFGKINELRLYHGEKYTSVQEAQAGDIVAIPGLPELQAGDSFGRIKMNSVTEPMMEVQVIWDNSKLPAVKMLEYLRILQDEDPTLNIQQSGSSLTLRTMGKIQLQVLQEVFPARFGTQIAFGPAQVLYRQTITTPAIGIGHYEPLRHYAEVHLRIVPTEPGSGISFCSLTHVDELALNWQRLIETHVFEKIHKGVLIGAPLTDVRFELLCGRDHLKHTEGGDFRQATYRAIRNALMYADSVLLQPVVGYQLSFPKDLFSTVTGHLLKMKAFMDSPLYDGETVSLRGTVALSVFAPWQDEYRMISHGRGTLRIWPDHYARVTDQERIVAEKKYNPLADDTPDSVFCSHGAGFNVAWDHVAEWAHCSHEGK